MFDFVDTASFVIGIFSSYFFGILVSIINYYTEKIMCLKRERKKGISNEEENK